MQRRIRKARLEADQLLLRCPKCHENIGGIWLSTDIEEHAGETMVCECGQSVEVPTLPKSVRVC